MPAGRQNAAREEQAFAQARAGRALLRKQSEMAIVGVAEAEAIGEERIVMGIAPVQRRLIGAARPGIGKPAAKVVADRSIGSAEEEIGDAATLAAGQEGGNERVGGVD